MPPERVEAMRLMTNKLKKVAKIPVEFENHFCSHLDPGTSAQLIAANELAMMDPKNKFNGRWKDKAHMQREDDWNHVPKHFYTNFKTNLVRDAHYMAKAIVNSRSSHSPLRHGHTETCDKHNAPAGASVKCGCKHKETKIDLKKRFRSYIGGIRSTKRSKDVIKNSYNLYKPYRPCRRTCCANHNPLFHAERMQQEHLKRLHASATKLMIMSVIPERPYSADSATRALREYQREIDYFQSSMHADAIVRRNTLLKKKSLKNRGSSIEGIAERGEREEEDPKSMTMSSNTLK